MTSERTPAPTPPQHESSTWYTPLVDVIETAEGFIFQADVPGVRAGDVDVSYQEGVLSIEGKVYPRQPQDHNYLWREYGTGHFYCQFTLDTPIDPDKIRVELKDGVLELHVPKPESARPRKIAVKAGWRIGRQGQL